MSEPVKFTPVHQAPKKILIERRRQEEEARKAERQRRIDAGEISPDHDSDSDAEDVLSSPLQSPLSIGSLLKDEESLQGVLSPFSCAAFSPAGAAQKSLWVPSPNPNPNEVFAAASGPGSHRSHRSAGSSSEKAEGDGTDSGYDQSPSIQFHNSLENEDCATQFSSPPPSNATSAATEDDGGEDGGDVHIERQLTLEEQRLLLKELQQRRTMMMQMGQDVPGLAQPLPIVAGKGKKGGKGKHQHAGGGKNGKTIPGSNSNSNSTSKKPFEGEWGETEGAMDLCGKRLPPSKEEPKSKRPRGKDITVFMDEYKRHQEEGYRQEQWKQEDRQEQWKQEDRQERHIKQEQMEQEKLEEEHLESRHKQHTQRQEQYLAVEEEEEEMMMNRKRYEEERERERYLEREKHQRERFDQELLLKQEKIKQEQFERERLQQQALALQQEDRWRHKQQNWRPVRAGFSAMEINEPGGDVSSAAAAQWQQDRLSSAPTTGKYPTSTTSLPNHYSRSLSASSTYTPSSTLARRSVDIYPAEPYPAPPAPPHQTSLVANYPNVLTSQQISNSISITSSATFQQQQQRQQQQQHPPRRSLSHPESGGTAGLVDNFLSSPHKSTLSSGTTPCTSASNSPSSTSARQHNSLMDYRSPSLINNHSNRGGCDSLSDTGLLQGGKDVLMIEEVGDKAIDLGLDGLYLPKDIKVEPGEDLSQDGVGGEGGLAGGGGGGGLGGEDVCQTCQVCGDLAAGFHCGAFVCEACKKFFVRCVKADSGVKFVCPRVKACIVTKETRTQCQYCRYQKCLSIGMYKPGGANVSSEIGHIPCKVCSAPSSGFHFGAITCEGCKGFFRRTVKERDSLRYQCSRGGNCAITISTRNVCKFCRYQKCLDVGMKPDGSRIGRQPNSVKHATMIELQQIKVAKGLPLDFGIRPKIEPPDSPLGMGDNRGGERMSAERMEQLAAQVTAAVMEAQEEQEVKSALMGGRDDGPGEGGYDTLQQQQQHQQQQQQQQYLQQQQHHQCHNRHIPPSIPPPLQQQQQQQQQLQQQQQQTYSSTTHLPQPPHPHPHSHSHHIRHPPHPSNITPPLPPPHHHHHQHTQPYRPPHQAPLQSLHPTDDVPPAPAQSSPALEEMELEDENSRTSLPPAAAAAPEPSPQSDPATTPPPAPKPPKTKYRGLELDATEEQVINAIRSAHIELHPILKRSNDLPVSFGRNTERLLVWQHMMGQFISCAHAVLKFAKKVPGFRKKPIDEQIQTVQSNMYPVVITILSLDFNLHDRTFNYFNLSDEERDTVWRCFPEFEQLRPTFLNVGEAVKSLVMDSVEVGFFCGIRLLSNDSNKDFQQLLRKGLYHYSAECAGSAAQGRSRAEKILDCLKVVEEANEIHQATVYQTALNPEYADLPKPDLFQETFLND